MYKARAVSSEAALALSISLKAYFHDHEKMDQPQNLGDFISGIKFSDSVKEE